MNCPPIDHGLSVIAVVLTERNGILKFQSVIGTII